MAAPSIRAVGAIQNGTASTRVVAIPPATVNGDLMILFVLRHLGGSLSGTPPDLPAGWTAVPGFPRSHSGNIDGPRSLVCWRIKQSGDSNPTITNVSPAAFTGVIISVQGDFDQSAPLSSPTPNDTNNSTTITTNNHTPRSIDELIFFAGFASNQVTGSDGGGVSGYSGTNPTFTERVDSGQLGGADGGNVHLAIATGSTTSSSALGARTASLVNARHNTGMLFAVQTPIGANPIKMLL